MLLFRHTKETSKNVAETTFKARKSILHDEYLLGRYCKLGGQSRITYPVATTFIFARFVKDLVDVTKFLKKKNYNSNVNMLSSRRWEEFGKKMILKSFAKMLKTILSGEDHFVLVKSQALRLQLF